LLGSTDLVISGGGGLTLTQVTSQTLVTANWALVTGYYEYNLANAGITATSVVDAIPNNASISIIKNAEILPKTLSGAGTVKFYAVNLPTGDIIVTINIFK
jgi:hypothetical protein